MVTGARIIEEEEIEHANTEGGTMTGIQIYRQQEIEAAQSFSPALFVDFVKWVDRCEKTTRGYLTNLKQFAAWMCYTGTTQPTRDSIIQYREWLTAEHDAIRLDPGAAAGWSYRTDRSGKPQRIACKPNTAAQYLRSVCQFFAWTAASGIYPNIAANIHGPKIRHDIHRKDALTAADVLAIERSIEQRAKEKTQTAQEAQKDIEGRIQRSTEQGARLYAMYLLAVNAGLRTIEISRANVKDLVTKGGQAWLYIWGKGHSEPDQRKPIAPEVAQAVREYLRIRADRPTGSSPLFVATGNRSGGQRMAATTISKELKRAMQAAGYDDERITAHSLRHTAGTAVKEITGDIYATQIYMRHSNPKTTEIYLHNDTEQADALIAQRLYNHYHSGKAPLLEILAKMNKAQLEQLAGIAAAMV